MNEPKSGGEQQIQNRAILVFADSIRRDLIRRRFPEAFGRLLEVPFAHSCLSREVDLHIYTAGSSSKGDLPANATLHHQPNRSFASDLETSLHDLVRSGYREIVIVGRDCPELTEEDVREAFRQLSFRRLVLGPDHRGGVYLIGLRAEDEDLIYGISWQRNTDFAQLQNRVNPESLFVLEVKQDIDSWRDFVQLARKRHGRILDRRLLRYIAVPLKQNQLTPLVEFHKELERQLWQLPPPRQLSRLF